MRDAAKSRQPQAREGLLPGFERWVKGLGRVLGPGSAGAGLGTCRDIICLNSQVAQVFQSRWQESKMEATEQDVVEECYATLPYTRGLVGPCSVGRIFVSAEWANGCGRLWISAPSSRPQDD